MNRTVGKFFILFWLIACLPGAYVKAQHDKLNDLTRQYEISLQEENPGKTAVIGYEIANIFHAQGSNDRAIDYLDKTIEYGNKADDEMLLYLGYQLFGTVYRDKGNHSKSLNNFQKALKIARTTRKNEFITDGLIDVAISYALLNRHKRSIAPLEEALALSIKMKDEATEMNCYRLLSDYHGLLGNNNKTVEYTAMIDKINSQQQTEAESEEKVKALAAQVAEADKQIDQTYSKLNRQSRKLRSAENHLLSVKYSLEETEERLKVKEDSLVLAHRVSENQQLQIALLNKENELADSQIREQQASLEFAAMVRNFIILAVFLAGGLAFSLIIGYRKKIEANREIEKQNEKINGSINYAKRIQEAMLHNGDLREELLPDSFILFRPRDSVSGDFYWISEIKSWYDPDIVVAAVDCTGHGIPGAFMSMIGLNSLNQIITEGVAETDQILNHLDKTIHSALQQDSTGNNDGMDVALCIYRKEKSVLEFSGAKNPLIYIQDNELHQIKGDVHAIGGAKRKTKKAGKEKSFKKHIVPIDQPTMIYLFSDGYQDQFGGEENTKFMAKKFKQLLLEIHQKPVQEQKEILENRLLEWMGEQKQTDDILVMGIRLDNALEA